MQLVVPSLRVSAAENLVYEFLRMSAKRGRTDHSEIEFAVMRPIWIIVFKKFIANAAVDHSGVRPVAFDVVRFRQIARRVHVLAGLYVNAAVANIFKTGAVGKVVVSESAQGVVLDSDVKLAGLRKNRHKNASYDKYELFHLFLVILRT